MLAARIPAKDAKAETQAEPSAAERKSVVPPEAVKLSKQSVQVSSPEPQSPKPQKLHLAPIDSTLAPAATPELLAIDAQVSEQYQRFMEAINLGNMWEYRKQGYRFLSLHAAHPLSPIVRWWMSYRLYLDREYNLAQEFLNDKLTGSSDLHSISLLVQARLYLAKGDRRYIDLYQSLEQEVQGTTLQKQVQADLAAIAKGGGS
jgi:hypothetical protein